MAGKCHFQAKWPGRAHNLGDSNCLIMVSTLLITGIASGQLFRVAGKLEITFRKRATTVLGHQGTVSQGQHKSRPASLPCSSSSLPSVPSHTEVLAILPHGRSFIRDLSQAKAWARKSNLTSHMWKTVGSYYNTTPALQMSHFNNVQTVTFSTISLTNR